MNKDEGYILFANKIVRSKKLDIYEKMLFAVLLSYNGNEKIFPSHTTLAIQAGMSRSKVIHTLKSLAEKGYITIAKDSEHRTNTYSIQKKGVYDNNSGVYRSDSDVYDRNTECVRGTQGGVYDSDTNNISINNINYKEEKSSFKSKKISNRTKTSQVVTDTIPVNEIIAYFNQKVGNDLSPSDYVAEITTIWNAGYRLPDFKKVIDNKYDDWIDSDKMRPNIQPSTLFKSPKKFSEYLQSVKKVDDEIIPPYYQKFAEDEKGGAYE